MKSGTDVHDAFQFDGGKAGRREPGPCTCLRVEIAYTAVPSQAIARTSNQFVLLKARAGAICGYMKASVSYLLEDIHNLQERLGRDEYMQLRAVWFNDATGGYVVHVDLVHDEQNEPSICEAQIRDALHHESVAYPDGQPITVETYFTPSAVNSELFSPICDSQYERIRREIGWR